MSIVLITGADARYFDLLKGAIRSVRDRPVGQQVTLAVLDLGLKAEQRRWVEGQADQVRQPEWAFDFAMREQAPAHLKGVLAKPLLPRIFPGFNYYLWLDADAWVQDWRAVELLLRGAGRGGLAVVPELDRASKYQYGGLPGYWEQAGRWYAASFGETVARQLCSYPMLNSGAIALHRDAPHWQAWADCLAEGLRRHCNTMIDQTALNVAVYQRGLLARTELLPAWCNWTCHIGWPAWDRSAGRLVEPYLPHEPIGIMHLTTQKHEYARLRTTDGGEVEVRVRYPAAPAEPIRARSVTEASPPRTLAHVSGSAGTALLQAASRCHQAGDLKQAQELYRQVLAIQPEHADAWHLLGLALSRLGEHAEALTAIRRAVALSDGDPIMHNNLGEACRAAGRPDEAAVAFRQALTLNPAFPEAHFNLGNVLKAQGRHEEATACYQQAVRLRPNYAKAHFNLGNTQREQGRIQAAVDAYRKALALQPDWPDALINHGNALLELDQVEEAIACYQQAQEHAPDHPDLDGSLGNAYLKIDRVEEARTCYRRGLARRPGNFLAELRLQGVTESVPASNEAIDEYRAQLLAALDRWIESRPAVDLAELHTSGAEPPMALAYQGRDDRPVKELYAALFAAALPPGDPPSTSGKPHVGIVVTHGHEGVFWRCLGGLVDRLSPADLRLTLVCSRSGANILRQWLRRPELEYLVLPERLDQAAALLCEAHIDLLHYWEVGTDSTNYFLPFLRPARVQIATWGWPVTTGNPRVDYFISSALLEPDDGDGHYTEKLVRLASLPTYYARPPVPAQPPSRGRFGLDESTLYLCPQNLRKFHPDFDPLVAGILRADPRGLFVVLGDRKSAAGRLLERLSRQMPDVADRVRLLPRLPEGDYLGLLAAADVVLDTPHYGGGANTTYDALAAGTPVITLLGPFHRGRYTGAAYHRMGIADGVAGSPAEYVRTAVRLGTDPDYRRDLGARIAAASEVLFEDARAVRELEEFFLQAVSGNGG